MSVNQNLFGIRDGFHQLPRRDFKGMTNDPTSRVDEQSARDEQNEDSQPDVQVVEVEELTVKNHSDLNSS